MTHLRSHKIVFEGRKVAYFTLFGSHERTIGLFCFGAVAQLEERLICIQEVVGSIPIGSTILPVSYTHLTLPTRSYV